LDLTSVNNITSSMGGLMAASSPLFQAACNSPALLAYAASLSASYMHQSSPLASLSALMASPAFYAATSPTVASQPSMFGNPLSTLTTPIQRTPANAQQQAFFQFPPNNMAAMMASMLSSPALHSPFLSAMALGTPGANPAKISKSPDSLKTPIPTLREI
jgi:hypothetical protein